MIKEMMQPPESYAEKTAAPDAEEKPQEASAQSDLPQDEPTLRVVLAAMKVLYDDRTSDGVVRMLLTGDPAQALMQTSLFVMRLIYNESRGRIPPEAMLRATEHVVPLLGEMAQAAGAKLDDAAVSGVAQQASAVIAQKLGGGQPNPGAAAPDMSMGARPQQGLVRQQMGVA